MSKKGFKEKVVQLYEALFEKEPAQILVQFPNYWDELFLLKANGVSLEAIVEANLGKDSKNRNRETFNLLFSQCIVALKEENHIRISNGLLTLCCLSRTVLLKRTEVPAFDGVDVLIGRQDIDLKLEILIARLCDLLVGETPYGMKALILRFLLILVTSYDSILENPIMDYLMSDHLFDAFIHLISISQLRQTLGYQTVLLLTLLVNYRKNQIVNPYIVKLSIVHNEVALNGYAQVISSALLEFNKKFDEKMEDPKAGSIFSTLTSMVGNMFVADDDNVIQSDDNNFNVKPSNSALLAFYGAIHLNRNFITLLTNSAETYEEPQASTEEQTKGNLPSNLLVTFLEFCSIVMLNTKDEANSETPRLCFIILTCISEDQCANAIMHDVNIAFRVQLHRMPMRHRKLVDDSCRPTRPLSYSLLDLMVEFILTHLRKTLLLDLHILCLGVIHRILCYQKKWKIRFSYPWTELWSALITLLKFIVNHESDLIKKMNVFYLAQQTINIFNLFITFGDTFLPSPQTYDQLYYEIIRMHIVFENLYSLALRHSLTEGTPYKESSTRLVNSLANIKAIINHFNPKIDSWTSSHEVESLTEENVLEVVRNNYDTLTLKLQDGLDSFESYSSDKPQEAQFFNQIINEVTTDYREKEDMVRVMKEHQVLMQEMIANVNHYQV